MTPDFITRLAIANAVMERHRMGPIPYAILLTLLERGPVSQQRLADTFLMAKSSMSWYLTRMVKAGLLIRFRSAGIAEKCHDLDVTERQAVLAVFARGTLRENVVYPTKAGKMLVAEVEKRISLNSKSVAKLKPSRRPAAVAA